MIQGLASKAEMRQRRVMPFPGSAEEAGNGVGGFGARLRIVREEVARRNRDDMCAEMGIGKNTLQAWEHGTRGPDARVVATMAKKYGVRLAWLYYGEGPMLEGVERDTTDLAYAKVVAQEPEAPRRSEPPPLVDSHPDKLDHKAMWGCIRAAGLLKEALELSANDMADTAMRMYAIAMASGEEGYAAATFAVNQYREGLKYRQHGSN